MTFVHSATFEERLRDYLQVACPKCGAAVGEPCARDRDLMFIVPAHRDRWTAMEDAWARSLVG